MHRSYFLIWAAAMTLIGSGCSSPFYTNRFEVRDNTTPQTLRQKLTPDYQPPPERPKLSEEKLNLLAYEELLHSPFYHDPFSDLNYGEDPNNTSLGRAFGRGADRIITEISDEGSFVDWFRDEVKGSLKWLEDHFSIHINGVHFSPILKGRAIGFKGSAVFGTTDIIITKRTFLKFLEYWNIE